MLRATREDPAAARATGISVYRQRLIAFSLSGALAGLAGGLYVHQLGLIAPDLTYLDLTFVTLAMLVFGGVASLWGAVLGALAISVRQISYRPVKVGRNPYAPASAGFTVNQPSNLP